MSNDSGFYASSQEAEVHGSKTLDQYLKPLAICIGHSPGISSLVVGGVKLIIDV